MSFTRSITTLILLASFFMNWCSPSQGMARQDAVEKPTEPMLAAPTPPSPSRQLILIVGAAGEESFGSQFQQWADRWKQAAVQADFEVFEVARISADSAEPAPTINDQSSAGATPTTQRELVLAKLEALVQQPVSELWLVYLGHGTFDGKSTRLNLVGPDLNGEELQKSLDKIPESTKVMVAICSSCSGGLLGNLASHRRVVLVATKNGSETNFARFGEFLSEAIDNIVADLDKDGRTSLLEAFLFASRATQQYYATNARLATEHALLEDNGDGKGTAENWFQGIRVNGVAQDNRVPDGLRAHQIFFSKPAFQEKKLSPEQVARSQTLEQEIESLIRKKAQFNQETYYQQLEVLLLEFSQLNQFPDAAKPTDK